MKTIKINISQLKKNRGQSLPFSFTVQAEDVLPEEFWSVFSGDVTIAGKVVNTGTGLLVEGEGSGLVRDVCARCLQELTVRITAPFSEKFLPVARQSDENEFYIYKTGLLDLKELASDVLLLGIPSKSLCADGCKGLCVVCGGNLNIKDCGCVVPPDPRLLALQQCPV